MEDYILIALIPFVGTILGSVTVFFIKDKLDEKMQKILTTQQKYGILK